MDEEQTSLKKEDALGIAESEELPEFLKGQMANSESETVSKPDTKPTVEPEKKSGVSPITGYDISQHAGEGKGCTSEKKVMMSTWNAIQNCTEKCPYWPCIYIAQSRLGDGKCVVKQFKKVGKTKDYYNFVNMYTRNIDGFREKMKEMLYKIEEDIETGKLKPKDRVRVWEGMNAMCKTLFGDKQTIEGTIDVNMTGKMLETFEEVMKEKGIDPRTNEKKEDE